MERPAGVASGGARETQPDHSIVLGVLFPA